MHVPVTNALPGASVPTLCGRVSVVLLVAFGLQLLVFLAEPPVRKPGTAGVGTGPFWFPWHRLTSFGHRKSPAG